MTLEETADLILGLQAADLALRNQLIEKGMLGEGYDATMAALHRRNAQTLDHVIDRIGYPTADLVGKAASEAAWLIIQHAIGQPKFMKKCAGLLEEAVSQGQANPIHLAYLTDRIAIFAGKPQRYGTAFDWDENGRMSPQPYDDLMQVNLRRQSLGLNSLEEQTAVMRQQVARERQQPPADWAARQQEYEHWRKKVGW